MAWDLSTSVLVLVSDITGKLVVVSVSMMSSTLIVVILTISDGVVRDKE